MPCNPSVHQLGVRAAVIAHIMYKKHCRLPRSTVDLTDQSLVGLQIMLGRHIIHRKFHNDKIGLVGKQIAVRPRAAKLGIRRPDTGIQVAQLSLRKGLSKPVKHAVGITQFRCGGMKALRDGTAEKTDRQLFSLLRSLKDLLDSCLISAVCNTRFIINSDIHAKCPPPMN